MNRTGILVSLILLSLTHFTVYGEISNTSQSDPSQGVVEWQLSILQQLPSRGPYGWAELGPAELLDDKERLLLTEYLKSL